MKKTILILAFFGLFASCKKQANELSGPILQEELSEDIELKVKGAITDYKPDYMPSETYNFLGFGYDVTDSFNDEVSIRSNVVDVSKYAASGTNLVLTLRSTQGSTLEFTEIDAVSLSKRFSNWMDVTKGHQVFGKTIEKTFPDTDVTNEKYVYGYYSRYSIWKRYTFYY